MNALRRALSVVFLVVLAGVMSANAQTPLLAGGKGIAPLLAEARARGTVRVIVELKLEPITAHVSALARETARHAAIGAARERFLERMSVRAPGRAPSHMRAYGRLPLVALELDEAAIQAMSDDPGVAAVYPDRLRGAQLAESVPLIGADVAATSGFAGAGQVVAVLDSGVDDSHPFLDGKVVHQACFSSQSGALVASSLCPDGAVEQIGGNAGRPCDVQGCEHGTHVAGIVAGAGGTFDGVAPDAQLMAVQIFTRFYGDVCRGEGLASPCAMTFDSDQIAALEHVYEQRDTFSIAAVNLSIGGGRFTSVCNEEPIRAAIEMLAEAGIATVVSAGNDGFVDALSSPACVGTAVSVGATTKNDVIAGFSNSAPALDLLAPGASISSSVPGGGYAFVSGTSMSAAHVSGAFAVLRSALPTARPDQVLAALHASGLPLLDGRNGLTVPRIRVDPAISALLATTGDSALVVTPGEGLAAQGSTGGPFAPESRVYDLENAGTDPLDFAVSTSAGWLSVTPDAGTLAPGEMVGVTVAINPLADDLPVGSHEATVRFTNLSNGVGGTLRTVSVAVVPPFAVNDKFSDALRVQTTAGSVTVTNDSAGKEPGEPEHAHKAGGASVWWRWTAPSVGAMTVHTTGSSIDTLLAAYTGDAVDALTEVASNDDEVGSESRIDFTAEAGETYYIAVDGVGAVTGNVVLNWRFAGATVPTPDIAVTPNTAIVIEGPSGGPFVAQQIAYTITNVSPVVQGFQILGVPDWLTASPERCCIEPNREVVVAFDVNDTTRAMAPGTYHTHLRFEELEREVTLRVTQPTPSNDAFAGAEALAGEDVTVDANNVGAGAEAGEPAHFGHTARASLWWHFTPDSDTHVVISTRDSAIDTTLGVYTGTSVATLSEVASSDDVPGSPASEVGFAATGGVTYRVAVDGHNGETGAIRLRLQTGVLRVPSFFPDIQSAVDAAYPGERVFIAEGTYPAPVTLPMHMELSGGWNEDFTGQEGLSTVAGEGDAAAIEVSAGAVLNRLHVIGGEPGILINGGEETLVVESEVTDGGRPAIRVNASATTLRVIRSTLGENGIIAEDACSPRQAGGIDAEGQNDVEMFVVNSTISDNVGCRRGAIYGGDPVHLIHSTLVDNRAVPENGVYPLVKTGGHLTVRNSIFGHFGYTFACRSGSLTAEGRNIGHASCGGKPAEPDLCLLGDYGGPTRSNGPVKGSPVLNRAPTGTCEDAEGAALVQDQRGEMRPEGKACDIGAVEGLVSLDIPTQAREWQPLEADRTWSYALDTGGTVRTRVLPGTIKVAGVQAIGIRDDSGNSTDYYTNDCRGLRLHRSDNPFPGVVKRLVFDDPPLRVLHATPAPGDVIFVPHFGGGRVKLTVPGGFTLKLNYEASSEVEGFEMVDVPAGTVNALRVHLIVRVSGRDLGVFVNEILDYTIWFARGIGEVKRRVDAFGTVVGTQLLAYTPEFLDPVHGSELSSPDATFSWSLNGTSADQVRLLIGTAPGKSDLFDSGTLSPAVTSQEVSALPMSGAPLYARLRFRVDGRWFSRDVTYPTSAFPQPALTGPVLHGLEGADAVFRWIDNGHAVEKWRLRIGRKKGRSHYFDSGVVEGEVRSQPVEGLPAYGDTLHARLEWRLRGKWHSRDYVLTAAQLPDPALVLPAGDSVDVGAALFQWSGNGHAVDTWRLRIGANAGKSDYFDSKKLSGETLSVDVPGIPTHAGTLHVRLQWRLHGKWSSRNYRLAPSGAPELTAPAEAALGAPGAEFEWTDNGHPVDRWRLRIGRSPGKSHYFDSGIVDASALSMTVQGLPTHGEALHVRLLWRTSGAWFSRDYPFTAVQFPEPALLLPVADEVDVTAALFEWTDNGHPVDRWRLHIGKSAGKSHYFDSGSLPVSTLSTQVFGIPPHAGTLHVRLQWRLRGRWSYRDYLLAPQGAPGLIVPADSLLEAADVNFQWADNAHAVERWRLRIGKSPGKSHYFDSGSLDAGILSQRVEALPAYGETLHARLQWRMGRTWFAREYVLAAADLPDPALVLPAGDTLGGAGETFQWTDSGHAVERWRLRIGKSPGKSNYFYSGTLAADAGSLVVDGLPTDGRTLYVRLQFRIRGQWHSADREVTAAGP